MKKTTLQRVLKDFAKTSMLMLFYVAIIASINIVFSFLFGEMAVIVALALVFICNFVLIFLKEWVIC